jgi:Domain of unknown function (DUF4259)
VIVHKSESKHGDEKMSAEQMQTFAKREARDWLNDLLDERDIYFVHNTLEIIVDYPADEKPDAWDCCCALAAAEIVAAACGHPPADLPEEAREWMDAYGFEADGDVVDLAKKALERVGSSSALRDEVDSSGQVAAWLKDVDDLRHRIGS